MENFTRKPGMLPVVLYECEKQCLTLRDEKRTKCSADYLDKRKMSVRIQTFIPELN
jgi:hypothetical protein